MLFSADASRNIVQKVAHIVAAVAARAGGPGCRDWPELLPAVFSLARAPTPAVRENALFLFARLADAAGAELLTPHASALLPVMSELLRDGDNGVRVAAMQGTIALITSALASRSADNSNDAAGGAAASAAAARSGFQALVPELFRVLQASLEGGADELVSREAISALVGLLTSDPQFLRPHMEPACACMLTISQSKELEEPTRLAALEFMVSLAECAGAMLRKMGRFVEATVTLALGLLALADDDADWERGVDDAHSVTGDEAEGDYADAVRAGANALQRLAEGVGRTLWPVLSAQLGPLLASPRWQSRRAALIALAMVSTGLKRLFAPAIRDILGNVLPYTRDAHPRVRHSAARCLGELIGDFSDPSALEGGGGGGDDVGGGTSGRAKNRVAPKSIQDAAADVILPALIAGLAASEVPRVRTVWARATVNFTIPEYCDTSNLGNSTRPLLHALFGVLTDGASQQEVSATCNPRTLSREVANGYSLTLFQPNFSAYTRFPCAGQRGGHCRRRLHRAGH